MSSVQIGQTSYEMSPREGLSIAHFLTVADVERSARYYEKVFDARLSVLDPHHINSFMNFRVADIQACYELWKARGAQFITEPIPKYGETRCYIRDPEGYIIEVGQSTDLTYG
jgi:predicted enzyme related to lactoylglutathione lyase